MTEPASPAEPATPAPLPPAEFAAAPPSSQQPVLWPVLREMLLLLRRHGLRMFLISFEMSLMVFASSLLMASVVAALQYCGIPISLDWWPTYILVYAAVGAMIGPMEASYSLIAHRLLSGEPGRFRALFTGYGTWRLFSQLAIVSGVFVASDYALNCLWSWLPWDFCWDYFSNIVTPGSPLDEMIGSIPQLGWLIGEFHFAARALILLPIQWALLEVIVAGKPWLAAVAGSMHLAWRQKRLALVMLGVLVVLSFDTWPRALLPNRHDYFQQYSYFVYKLVDWLQLGANAAITCAVTAIKAAGLVVVYQAMRNRDAATQPESA